MKKAISLVLTLCMMLSLLAVSACAENSDTGFPAVLDYPKVGFHFESPESFRNAKGTLDMGAVFLADNILQTEVIYYGVAPEQFEEYCNFGEAYVNALLQDEELPEDISAEEVKIGKEQHMYVYTLPTSDEVPSIIFGAIYLNDKNNDNRYIVLEKAYNQLGVEHLALRTYNNEMDCLLDEPFKGAITKANFIKLAKKEIKKPVPIKENSED